MGEGPTKPTGAETERTTETRVRAGGCGYRSIARLHPTQQLIGALYVSDPRMDTWAVHALSRPYIKLGSLGISGSQACAATPGSNQAFSQQFNTL